MTNSQIETEKVTLEVPKQIMKFLRHHEKNPKAFLEKALINIIRACNENDQIWGSEDHIEMYNLQEIFQKTSI